MVCGPSSRALRLWVSSMHDTLDRHIVLNSCRPLLVACSVAADCKSAAVQSRGALVRGGCLAAAPVVSGGPPKNVVGCGSQTVTTTGLHFWSTDYTASIALGGMTCGTSSWSSSTSLVCVGSVDSAGGSYMHATIGSVLATASAMFSFDGATHALHFLSPSSSSLPSSSFLVPHCSLLVA